MSVRNLVKRSVGLTCLYYELDDWLTRRRSTRGSLRSRSGNRHRNLELDASLGYIDRVYRDYLAYGGLKRFAGVVAEIGPGDNFGVALRMLGDGAHAVHAIDRWKSERDDAAQRHIYEALSTRFGLQRLFDGTPGEDTIRGLTYNVGQPAETFFRDSGIKFDAIVSRAVMEHLYDPIGALDDMAAALNPGGIMIHRVDLRDHGMFAGHHPLTFLTIPEPKYGRMTRGAGRPNRVLVPAYRDWLTRSGLDGAVTISRLVGIAEEFEPAAWDSLDADLRARAIGRVHDVRPLIAPPLVEMADQDLAVSGCVLVASKLPAGTRETATPT